MFIVLFQASTPFWPIVSFSLMVISDASRLELLLNPKDTWRVINFLGSLLALLAQTNHTIKQTRLGKTIPKCAMLIANSNPFCRVMLFL